MRPDATTVHGTGREYDGKLMSNSSDCDPVAASPFAGLMPSKAYAEQNTLAHARHLAERESNQILHERVSRGLFATLPVLLIGTMAMTTVTVATASDATSKGRVQRQKSHPSTLHTIVDKAITATQRGSAASATDEVPESDQVAAATVTTAAVTTPSHYTVVRGDTVGRIASRYRLSTGSVLALNGLSRTSLIFPGQVLKLTGTVSSTTPAPSAPVHAAAALQTVPASFTAPLTASGSYTIKRGDTVTSIARQFGTTVKQILAANNLSPSSMIYAGRTLVIPGGTVTPQASPPQIQISQVGAVTVPLSPTMQTNAQTIIAVGKRLGVPSYGIIIALAAAAQESGLQNLNYGDQDSVGLFQQRPSAGWGNDAQLENPTYASELFYGGPSNPNIGRTRGLLDIPGWQSMSVTQAAQAVQSSAYPLAYAKWEASARSWYALLG